MREKKTANQIPRQDRAKSRRGFFVSRRLLARPVVFPVPVFDTSFSSPTFPLQRPATQICKCKLRPLLFRTRFTAAPRWSPDRKCGRGFAAAGTPLRHRGRRRGWPEWWWYTGERRRRTAHWTRRTAPSRHPAETGSGKTRLLFRVFRLRNSPPPDLPQTHQTDDLVTPNNWHRLRDVKFSLTYFRRFQYTKENPLGNPSILHTFVKQEK